MFIFLRRMTTQEDSSLTKFQQTDQTTRMFCGKFKWSKNSALKYITRKHSAKILLNNHLRKTATNTFLLALA